MSLRTRLARRGELLELYRRIMFVRVFDRACGRSTDDGPTTACADLAAAAAFALDGEDYGVTADHGYRFAVARGVAPEAVVGGLLGERRTRGDWRVVDGGLRAATELAGALRDGARRAAVLCMPGSGGSRPPAVHRALGIAAARRLPVVFVIHSTRWRIARAAANVDIDDASAVHEAVARLLSHARRGNGPAVLEVVDRRERTGGIHVDALSLTAARLAELGAPPEDLLEIAADAERAVTAAIERVSADAVSTLIAATNAR